MTDQFQVANAGRRATLPGHSVIVDRPVWATRVALILPVAGAIVVMSEPGLTQRNPLWISILCLCAVAMTGLAWWLGRPHAAPVLDLVERHAAGIAAVITAMAVVAFVLVNVIQARDFGMSVYAEDTAYYSQILWNTLQGNFLAGNLHQERLFNPPVANDLAVHVSPVLLAALLPLYSLFPDFVTLLIARDVALGAAAWPLFLLARERLGGTAAVAAVMLYLANPAVTAQGLEAFYPLQLAPLPFFFAMRAFVRSQLGSFLIWMSLAIGVREDVAIVMAGFGLLALVQRRRLAWVAAGFLPPVAWWALATLVIQPAFGRWGNNVFEIAFAEGQPARWGLYEVLLGNPSWILDALHEGGWNYLYRVLRCVGFIGLLGWEGLLALPALAANLLLARTYYGAIEPISRFAVLPSCALVGAAVLVVTRLARRYPGDGRTFAVIVLLLLPSASIADGLKDVMQVRRAHTTVNDAGALREAMALIPDTASVAAPNYALPVLAERRRLLFVTHLHLYPNPEVDYLLLDRDLDRITVEPGLRERYRTLLETTSASPHHEIVWQRGAYLLVRRIEQPRPAARTHGRPA